MTGFSPSFRYPAIAAPLAGGTWNALAEECSMGDAPGIAPLGLGRVAVYEDGGYGMLCAVSFFAWSLYCAACFQGVVLDRTSPATP